MTLQRFLVGLADWILARPGWRRCRPSANRAMPLGTWMALASIGPMLGVVAGLVLMVLALSTPMRGSWWPVRWLGGVGLVMGVFDAALLAVAWNRRAAGLRSAGLTELPTVTRRRWWPWLLLGPIYGGLFLGVTPFALWLSIDNYRGTREWRKAHAALVARGEPLTLEQLQGAPPADDENFAATPLIRPLLDYRIVVTNKATEFVWADPPARHRLSALALPTPIEAADAPRRRRSDVITNDVRLDLESYARGIRAAPLRSLQHPIDPQLAARYGVTTGPVPKVDRDEAAAIVVTNAAVEVLEYLRRFEPEMEELSRAAARPRSRFPLRYEDLQLGQSAHLAVGKSLSQLFRVRAAARLRSGDAVGALADTRTLLRMSRMLEEQPVLISRLVQIAQTAIAIQGVAEGLAARVWTDAQITELQRMVAGIDLQKPMAAALQGERWLGNGFYDALLGGPIPGTTGSGDPSPNARLFGFPTAPPWIAPHGFFRRNQVEQNRVADRLIAEILDPGWPASMVPPKPDAVRMRELGLSPANERKILVSLLVPALDKAHYKAARQNTAARMGETACALERYRLKHGRHPERLEDLVPAFLGAVPADPMDRKPLRYERLAGEEYRLWSVGLNGRDDGGVTREPAENDRSGDWVWPRS